MTVSDPLLAYLFIALLFVLALLRPRWAILVCAAILPTYLFKLQLFGIPTTVLEVSIWAVFAGSFLRELFLQSGRGVFAWVNNVREIKLFWPILLFAAGGFASALFSERLETSLGGWKAWVLDPLLFAILFIQFAEISCIRRRVLALGASAALLSVYGIWEYVFAFGQLGDGRLDSVFDPANYHALFVGPIIILLAGFFKEYGGWQRIAASLFLALNIIALVLTFSYGGYLAVLGGLLLIGFMSLDRVWKKRMLWAAVGLSLIFLAVAAPTKKFQDLFEFQDRSSSHARLEIWKTSALIFQEHPLLGVGLNNFESHYRKTVPRVAFPPLEWLVAQPHNLYLALLTELGVLGFAAFAWIVVQFFRLIKTTSNTPYSLPLAAAMTTILLHGFIDTPYFKNDLSILFWIIIASAVLLCADAQKKSHAR